MKDSRYLAALREHVLIFDGAMGTSIQLRDLGPEDFGGQRLDGCNDHLVLSRPDVVQEIHASFLEVGCDVVETNTFRANRLAVEEYGLGDRIVELNTAAARIARAAADRYSTPDHPRFVAGSIGPSGFLPSASDPTLGNITYDELVDVFAEQARGLVEGGVDVLLIETSQDMLEVKAQITGIRRCLAELGAAGGAGGVGGAGGAGGASRGTGKAAGANSGEGANAGVRPLPIQAQVTLDPSGRMLLGTDIAAAMTVLEALRVDVIGLNCSTGPEHMREPVRFLSEHSRLPISVIPNAGIPHNEGGEPVYPLTPEELAAAHEEFVTRLGVSVVGGCCGTTPEHLRQVVERVRGLAPAVRPRYRSGSAARKAQGGAAEAAPGAATGAAAAAADAEPPPPVPRLASAMTAVDMVQIPGPTLIGERVNAQGSRAVKRRLLDEDYDGILDVARGQVEGGAHLLDVCVAVTERDDEADQMAILSELLAQSVEAPLVIDSTEADAIEAALKNYPGRALINSVNLENGRKRIDSVLPLAVEHGAAVIALTIDTEGMAKTADRKVEIARRIADILIDDYGLSAHDIVFDDLTFTLATGEEEFRHSAVETIDGIRRIKAEIPGVLTSLGVSNVSFGLQPHARAVLNSVFLHHCVDAGLDMAIVNPAHITPYAEIDTEQRALAEDLILNRREDALERFIEFYQEHDPELEEDADPTADMSPEEAIHWHILHRRKDGVEELVDAAIQGRGGDHDAGVWTLNNVLLPAMKEVGDKFGAGELILPFVLQSAEVMKRAVVRLETYLEKVEGQSKGTVVLATVFGDVHDIGKNLVHTILENNGYTVHDLGKQVPLNDILDAAVEHQADVIGLSALLVSTSKQMPLCVRELSARGLSFPVMCGGAAINPSFVRGAAFTDDERTSLYDPGVWYCKDAFAGLATVDALVDDARRADFVEERHREVVEGVARRAELKEKAKDMRPKTRAPAPSSDVDIPEAPFLGVKVIERLPLEELFELIDLNTLYRLHWGAKNAKGEQWDRLVHEEYEPRLERYKHEALASGWIRPKAAYGYFRAAADGDALVVYDERAAGSAADGSRAIGAEPGAVRATGAADPAAGESRPGESRPGAAAVAVEQAAATEIARFPFPRQSDRDELCLADYFAPADDGPRDVVGFQIVTVGDELLERSERMMKEGDYSEGYYLHGFGVRLAEAAAELVHRRMRSEMGLPADRGLRYSWGYGACPDHTQHSLLYELLPARERLGMDVTEAGALVPELSTAALVVHHPDAKYFTT